MLDDATPISEGSKLGAALRLYKKFAGLKRTHATFRASKSLGLGYVFLLQHSAQVHMPVRAGKNKSAIASLAELEHG